MRRGAVWLGVSLACAAGLAVGASPAAASITLGQVAPPNPAVNCSNVKDDWVQPSVTSGNSYAAPVAGTVTSWSTSAGTNANQVWTLKVFRPNPAPPKYKVVGVDGPHPLTSGVLNTFATTVPVQPGDLIGMNDNDTSTPASTTCAFNAPGNTIFFSGGSAPLGGSTTIATPIADRWLNLSAVLEPTNTFRIGAATRNGKRGTATFTVTVPNPGQLAISGNGIVPASPTVSPTTAGTPGDYQLSIATTGTKRRKLRKRGKVKVKPKITFTPTGGEPKTSGVKVILKLKKRPKH